MSYTIFYLAYINALFLSSTNKDGLKRENGKQYTGSWQIYILKCDISNRYAILLN